MDPYIAADVVAKTVLVSWTALSSAALYRNEPVGTTLERVFNGTILNEEPVPAEEAAKIVGATPSAPYVRQGSPVARVLYKCLQPWTGVLDGPTGVRVQQLVSKGEGGKHDIKLRLLWNPLVRFFLK